SQRAGAGELPAPRRVPRDAARLDERAHQLEQEERVALARLVEPCREPRLELRAAERGARELLALRRLQGLQHQVLAARLALQVGEQHAQRMAAVDLARA